MDADDVAEQLYGLPPEEFTAARDEHAAQARAAGDKAVAAAIAKLRRPTVAAWLANLLVRAHPAEVERLGAVGESLRQAQRELSGAQLRELAGVRRQTIRALADQARSLARAADHPPSDAAMQQLEDTLSAALADAGLAARLREGRLTVALSYSGFGGLGVGASGTDQADRPIEPDRGTARTTETKPVVVADQPMAADQAVAEQGAGDEATAGREESEQAAAETRTAERAAAERAAAEREAERAAAEQAAAVEQAVADAETAAASANEALRAARAKCATAENAAGRAEQAAQALRAEVTRAEREATQAREAVGRAERQARAAERARQRAEDALDRACLALRELERGQARSGRR